MDKLQSLLKEAELDTLGLTDLSIELQFSLIPYDLNIKTDVLRNLLMIKRNMSIYNGIVDKNDERYIQTCIFYIHDKNLSLSHYMIDTLNKIHAKYASV